ncbi:helicase-exonuclease AddAB subunit AddB [Ectobacillus antri]|jgi:ATP-dependent helicase/nuclease subunit B|uniref:ATP-dependent helicase/deoxyribonuclease subunit B n=1 Tax=Ectobacillus antri TaxID=2486280 RepID=A0ABT6H3Y5_9BACI|nr:helicase-exonuclease AddAB subunit AddB [Ectobacillus antri]MDG4656713.1 helicase-exonuclease AddAB subunit AddB [Ectobacillus antri]MDG5753924.1 helicase-exonuclease AddAB subunit AddB [Ectobacillus antri]
MSLRIVLGRAGTGKSALCLREMHEELKQRPKGDSIIYLVPEQMSFQAQQALGSSIRAQVFSFSRLAWKVLQETGGTSRLHIDEAGVNMLLRKIVEARKGELRVFQKAAKQNGFFGQLGGMIAELKRHNVTPADMYRVWREVEDKHAPLLASKMHDLQLLYEDFERALIGKYLDSEDYVKLLAEKLPQSSYMKNAIIYADGFHTFLPQELDVLKRMLQCGAKLTVTLVLDAPQKQEMDLFYTTARTYERLMKIATDVRIKANSILLEEPHRFKGSASLAHIEKHFESIPPKYFAGSSNLTVYTAANRQAEVEGVAREIRRLVREEGYRYRDIAVMLRNGTSYNDSIKAIFAASEIPFFIDEKRLMLHHPLVELIRSVLEVIEGNWRYEAVFRCIKTELLFPRRSHLLKLREEMDAFENYCLAYGMQGKKWTNGERWTYRRYRSLETTLQTDNERETEERMNNLRDMVVKPIFTLQKRLKRAKSVRKMCEAVYLFLEELRVPRKLEAMRKKAEEEGNLLFANDHEQVWHAVIDLLDKYVEMLGDENMSLQLFSEVMSTGLASLHFANIPPSLDQVLIANIDRSRLANVRALFLIGANEGVIPGLPADVGMLSDEERETLLGSGIELASTTRQKMLEEQFIVYQALTRASHRLYISCPFADEEGKVLLPSGLFKKLKALVPSAEQEFLTNEVQEGKEEYITTPAMTLSHLVQQLQLWKQSGYKTDLSFWWDVYNFYVQSPQWQEHSKRVLSSLFYRNEAKPLHKSVSLALYGETIKGSVSRMELFQRCSYAHFAQHGLALRERDIFTIDAPDIGELFHAALKSIADRLTQQSRSWADLSRTECEHLAMEAMEMLAPLLQKEILLSSNRHHYLKHKLQQIIFRASLILSEHAKSSGFVPVDLEVPFGIGADALPPLHFQLANGTKMEVVGRIDRVDMAEGEKGTFLRIIDYKSSAKSLDMTEVYYGLALQMLTYLDVVIENAGKWVKDKQVAPAGVLYFHVHNPVVEIKGDATDADIDREILRKFKMKGLLLGDTDVVRLMDASLTSGSSDIVSAGLKKDGTFSAYSSIASEQEFHTLKQYVRRKFQDIGTSITEGVIDIAPYKLKTKAACGFCQFKSVCQFDESLQENEYRVLRPLKEAEALLKMREEGDR